MEIRGIEGLSRQQIEDELRAGGRFVCYEYCISILIMTFKRPSAVYFIRAGENRTVKGLQYSVISLLFGWWGIPWGPIYTISSVIRNLCGGRDVTGAV